MKERYMYSKIKNHELYAVLDYYKDQLIRWCTDEKTAKEITKALNEAEYIYDPEEIEDNLGFFN